MDDPAKPDEDALPPPSVAAGAPVDDIPLPPRSTAAERVARRRAEARGVERKRRLVLLRKLGLAVAAVAAFVAIVAAVVWAAPKVGELFKPPPVVTTKEKPVAAKRKVSKKVWTPVATGTASSGDATGAPDAVRLAATDYKLPRALDPETISQGHPKQKLVAITIDDGIPFNEKLLDLFEANDVRLTTFVLGQFARSRPDLIRRLNNDGFEIANHSWDHPFLTKLSDDQVRSQLRRTQAAISKVTGNQAPYLRPPFGATDKRIKRIAAELGYKIVLWNRTFADTSKSATPEQRYKNVMDGLAPGDIILCHWGSEDTYQAMKRILPEMKRRGFTPVTLSEMLADSR